MQSEFSVGRVKVNAGRTVIIAEAGVNHLKDISLAERLIATAAKAGADIIKFQTYSADGLVVKESPRFWDWNGEKVSGGTQHDSYSPLATPELEFTADLKGLCDKYEIEFMSTPFDEETLGVLESLDTPAYKIASGDITNFILLDAVAATGKPIFLSTGGSTAAEVDTAVKRLKQKDASALCVMHCSLSYPTRMQDAHLLAISALSEQFLAFQLVCQITQLGRSYRLSVLDWVALQLKNISQSTKNYLIVPIIGSQLMGKNSGKWLNIAELQRPPWDISPKVCQKPRNLLGQMLGDPWWPLLTLKRGRLLLVICWWQKDLQPELVQFSLMKSLADKLVSHGWRVKFLCQTIFPVMPLSNVYILRL